MPRAEILQIAMFRLVMFAPGGNSSDGVPLFTYFCPGRKFFGSRCSVSLFLSRSEIDFASRFPPRHFEAARLRGFEARKHRCFLPCKYCSPEPIFYQSGGVWGSSGVHFRTLGSHLGSLWIHFGALGGYFRTLVSHFGSLGNHFGALWGHLGAT